MAGTNDAPRDPKSSAEPKVRSPAERDAASFAGNPQRPAERAGLHRLLVDSVRDYAIFALDPDGNVLSWNAGAEYLKGYSADEIIGRHFSVFYPPEKVAEKFPQYELEVARKEGRFEDEGWRIRKDGSRFWANVVITALRDKTGTLVGFAKVTRDLTERFLAEEALRESEERFRLLVQGVKDYAIFMLDPTGRVASWNEGAQRIKGYEAAEIIGRHFSTFYPAEDVAGGKPERELEIAQREGKYEEEGWRVRKDGSLFWASVLITAVRSADGRLVGFAKVTRDLTERRAADERALADARRVAEAETATRIKGEFLAAMSHELRTPINATLGYTELLSLGLRGPVTETQLEDLERIRISQQYLLGIITDLLNYSRMEAGQMEYDLSPVPIQAIVDAVFPMVEPQAQKKGLTLERITCDDGLVVQVDRTKGEQVMLNLLSNAVKFTPEGGRVTVRCTATDGNVTVSVGDTGPGIPEDKQEAIFEPFVQLGRSRTSSHEGTGLGLAISRDLARAMGGDVTVKSAPGQGATFAFVLPRAAAASVLRRG
ncbi:MAG TPA: PAS domain-containing sensor histidine kinase [Gemmatimonadaceae bacterium]|nr:PAS domain-containing sensor histidine kinase [Gemmatimonadaceae bacterium]